MMDPASTTKVMLKATAAITIKRIAVYKISLAESCLFSPRLLATSAEIETFNAKKRASPKSFGCVVSPTAATEAEPKELTIKESISPAKATKKDSTIAGHAMSRVVKIVSL